MATKQELLDKLEAAGVEGYSMANSHAELAAAVRDLEPDPVVDRRIGV